MPAVSDRQRRFMGAELGRKEAGEKTSTGMSMEQLRDFARKSPSMKKNAHNKHKRMHRPAKVGRTRGR